MLSGIDKRFLSEIKERFNEVICEESEFEKYLMSQIYGLLFGFYDW